MTLTTRVSKVSLELNTLAEQYALRTPEYPELVEQILTTGAQAVIKGQFTAEYAKHLAAMTIAVLALIEPEVPLLEA